MATIVAHGLTFPEGPLHTMDGRTLLVQIGTGEVSEIRDGVVRPAAIVRGAPHAVIEGDDGWLYVTQAGNVTIGTNATPDPVPAGIQRVSPEGEVSYVVSAEDNPEIRSPNDLCFGPDGRLYFTDTGGSFDPSDATQVGRIFAIDAAGHLETVAELGPVFTNGIAFDRRGRLLWTETYPGLVCRMENGARRVVADTGNGIFADGIKAAMDGRLLLIQLTPLDPTCSVGSWAGGRRATTPRACRSSSGASLTTTLVCATSSRPAGPTGSAALLAAATAPPS